MTTPDALAGLVNALREIGRTHQMEPGTFSGYEGTACDTCDAPVEACCDPKFNPKECDGGIARAALDAWEKREPLGCSPPLAGAPQWEHDMWRGWQSLAVIIDSHLIVRKP